MGTTKTVRISADVLEKLMAYDCDARWTQPRDPRYPPGIRRLVDRAIEEWLARQAAQSGERDLGSR